MGEAHDANDESRIPILERPDFGFSRSDGPCGYSGGSKGGTETSSGTWPRYRRCIHFTRLSMVGCFFFMLTFWNIFVDLTFGLLCDLTWLVLLHLLLLIFFI
jgi:hypothetical protein